MFDDVESLPVLLAHRGARSIAPENTPAAAKKAVDCGAYGWEADVHLTKDGELVLIHDDTVLRTSNASSVFSKEKSPAVSDLTLSELLSLDFGSWFAETDPFGEIKAGNVSSSDIASYKNTAVATLEQALSFSHTNHLFMNVEIKDMGDGEAGKEAVRLTIDAVQKTKMEKNVVVSSFNWNYLNLLKDLNPNIPTGALTLTVEKKHIKEIKSMGVDAYHPKFDALPLDILTNMKDEGICVNIWTVNTEKDLAFWAGKNAPQGITAVITDYPQRAVALRAAQ